MFKCICGTEMIWGSDFDFADYGYDEDGVVSYYSCPNCECSMEFFMPCKPANDEVNVYPGEFGGEDNE